MWMHGKPKAIDYGYMIIDEHDSIVGIHNLIFVTELCTSVSNDGYP